MSTSQRPLTWVEVDAGALHHNLSGFRSLLTEGVMLTHVVKSNAYGHGLELVAREDEGAGIVDELAVISVEEAVRLRDAGVRLPIVILGYVPESAWTAVVEAEASPVVMNRESLEPLSRAALGLGKTVRITLKAETGTHRYGLPEAELVSAAHDARMLGGIELEGITTHFANIEDTTDHSYAQEQLDRFTRLEDRLRQDGFPLPRSHTACSAATILFPESHRGRVRVGISSYGIWPSKETRVSAGHLEQPALSLRPVMRWLTRVGQVKPVPAGGFVGYGCTWRAPIDSRIAVLPVGYADGFDRKLSNVGHVLVRGQRAPIRGRVCMNVTLADVTHIPHVSLEDEVVLLGDQGEERITPEDMAGWAGTIPYEIVARISTHLPRVTRSAS